MSGGLSNADFRRLLATPRPGAASGGSGGGGGGGGQDEKQKKHKKPKPPGFKPGGKLGIKEGEAAEEGPKYRDRAAERRKGMSADFEGVPDDLVGLLEGKGDLRHVSYEDSKYLGGDVAHTHLVKGLDFALLQKVRAEQEAKKREGGGSDGEEEAAAPVLAKTVQLQQQVPAATFQTAMGRAIHAFFFDPKARGTGLPVAELFLPRRTAFVYDLEEPEAPDIPTTLRRSKEDCPKVHETAMGGLDSAVLDKIAKIMSYMTVQGGGKKRLKRREREALLQQHGIQLQGQIKGSHAAAATGAEGPAAGPSASAAAAKGHPSSAPPPSKPADEDDDIFGDAGTDYQPTVKDKKKQAAAAAAAAEEQQRRGGYFGGGAEDLHADLPPLPSEDAAPPPPPPPEDGETYGPSAGPARPPAGYDAAAAYAPYPEADAYPVAAAEQTVAAVARQEKQKEKRRAADVLGGGDEAYAECYPSYYDYGTVLEDSDDEGGRPEPQALTRRDFASEADWQEYQASGMPSRQAEGRAKVRQQQRDASKEKNKLQSQLGKIQKIMEDKGYDHTSAFGKQQKGEPEGGGDGGADGGSGAAFTKRRRI